ncbi:hypothetical protein BpHYR1_047984 [Brachionus plicatilis]|uniref:Uncharacterized protein n=1 Tax=Brachionus plicatilis TaxID=10195 RepID=A0A3M7R4Q6_BRAPC|nr:hypothetical protein BpHYR1_047984 [Brachionus plicatilis]
MIKYVLIFFLLIAAINSQSVVELPDEFLDPADIADYNRQLLDKLASNDTQFMSIALELTVHKSKHRPQSIFDHIIKKTLESIMDSISFLAD